MNPTRILLFFLLLIVTDLRSQSKQALEKQKKEIQNEIKVIELKLSNSSKKKGLIISNAEDLNYKIKLQQNLISNINNQLNLILNEIDANEIQLTNLKNKEASLKEELAKMKVLFSQNEMQQQPIQSEFNVHIPVPSLSNSTNKKRPSLRKPPPVPTTSSEFKVSSVENSSARSVKEVPQNKLTMGSVMMTGKAAAFFKKALVRKDQITNNV